MGGGPIGGKGIDPNDPAGVADDAKAAKPPISPGVNLNSDKDCKTETRHNVEHTEGNGWINVSGSKHEIKVGGYFEFLVGAKHGLIQGSSTEFAMTNSNARTFGLYATELLAAKYEILGKKKEVVKGDKTEKFIGPWRHLTKGKYTSKNAKLVNENHAIEKEINEVMAKRVGALLEEQAQQCVQKIKEMDQKITKLDLRVANECRLKSDQTRLIVKEMQQTIDEIKMQVGKFERKTQSMKEAVSSLMEIKGSEVKSRNAAYKVRCQVMKFASSLVKLGE